MFGRWKERAIKAEAELELVKTQLAAEAQVRREAEEEVRDWKAEHALLKSQREEVLRDRDAAVRRHHELEVKNAVLLERLDLVTNYFGGGMPGAPRVQGPTSVTEEVEDAVYAFKSGQINKTELEKQLQAAGFDNTEIDFELADYPRHAQS